MALFAITSLLAGCYTKILYAIDGAAAVSHTFPCPPDGVSYIYNQSATTGTTPIPPAPDGSDNHQLQVIVDGSALLFDYAVFGTVDEVADFLNPAQAVSTTLSLLYATASAWPTQTQPTTSSTPGTTAASNTVAAETGGNNVSDRLVQLSCNACSPILRKTNHSSHHKSAVGPAVGGAIAGVVILTLAIVGFLFFKRRHARRMEAAVSASHLDIDAYHTPPAYPPGPTMKEGGFIPAISSTLAHTLPPSPSQMQSTSPSPSEPGALASSVAATQTTRPMSSASTSGAPPSAALLARRASTMQELMRAGLAPELIVQVLDNMREESDAAGGPSSLQQDAAAARDLPRGAASPAPPGYDFKH